MFDLARVTLTISTFLFFTLIASADVPLYPLPTEQQIRENYSRQESELGSVPVLVARVIALSGDKTFFRLHPARTVLIEGLANSYLYSGTPKEILDANRNIVIEALTNELSTDEIAIHYAQRVFFGLGCRGVHGAAQAYFGKRVDNLTLAEMTLLGAVILYPDMLFKRPEVVLKRRNGLIEIVAAEGLVSREDAATAALSDLSLIEPVGKCPRP
jgi:hypothetical protein